VELGSTDGLVHVRVTDNGTGLADERRGSGLRGLRDRVESVGGSFRLVSQPEVGTTIRADFPLAEVPVVVDAGPV
jgi:signal transduction histidine kinase